MHVYQGERIHARSVARWAYPEARRHQHRIARGGSTLLVSQALGLPVRTVAGYGGTTEIRSAMASGEVDGICLSRSSYQASFLPREDYVPVLQGGEPSDMIAEVPLAENLAMTERARKLLAVASAVGGLTRFIALPPRRQHPSSRQCGMRLNTP